jgi:hypothetical protein
MLFLGGGTAIFKHLKRKGKWEMLSIISVIAANNVIREEVLINR